MKGREREKRGSVGERQVESTVAVATSPIYGKWGYHIAKVRLLRRRNCGTRKTGGREKERHKANIKKKEAAGKYKS